MKKTALGIFVMLFIAIGLASVPGNSTQYLKNANMVDSDKKICITTSFGDIKIKLYNSTPLHRDNFIKLVKEGYFDGTLFHRVINKFMIQGGDPESKTADSLQILGNGGPAYTIPAEFIMDSIITKDFKTLKYAKYFHKRGALGAAREGDNVNPLKASSGSQFYIVQGRKFTEQEIANLAARNGKHYSNEQITAYTTDGGTPHLDNDYTVFGEVYEGMEVVDKIAAVATGKYDRPLKDVKMSIKIIE